MKTKFVILILCLILSPFRAFATAQTMPEGVTSGKEASHPKTVYLTFDDGPTGKINKELLQILKENNVQATFFVVGKQIEQFPEVLLEIYHGGHSIGLHSYSHNFRKIYRNDLDFINEMKQVEQEIFNTIGIDSKIIRFPGGSAGNLDRDFLEKIHHSHYKVFDWTISLEDGNHAYASVSSLVKKATTLRNDGDQIILAHCNSNNKNTCKALPLIIKKYREMGYVFKPITYNTHEYFFKMRK